MESEGWKRVKGFKPHGSQMSRRCSEINRRGSNVVITLPPGSITCIISGGLLGEFHRAGMTDNPCKCHLGLTETQCLGYHIGQGLLKSQESKVETVKSYSCPTTKHLLGVDRVVQTLCARFLLSRLLPFRPEKVSQRRFGGTGMPNEPSRASRLVSSPVLKNPDFSLTFLVHIDTSKMRLGTVLSQEFDSKEHPIVFTSHKLLQATFSVLQRVLLCKYSHCLSNTCTYASLYNELVSKLHEWTGELRCS